MRAVWRYARWVLLGLLLVVSGWLAWTAKLRSEFEERLEALREAGEPLELSELMPAATPDEENAAPLLERAAEMIGDVPLALDDDPRENLFDDEEEAAAQEWLARQGDTIALLHEAAARPGCNSGIDWTRGFEAEVQAIPDAQAISQTLEAYARREAAAGRPGEALRCVVTLFRIGDHMPRPSIICYLVRTTLHGIAMETLEDLSRAPGFDIGAATAAMEPRLREAERIEPLLFAVQAERAMFLSLVRRWIAGESPREMMAPLVGDDNPLPVPVSDWLWSSWLTRPFAYRDGLYLIDDIERALQRLEARAFDELARSGLSRRGLPYPFSSLFVILPRKLGSTRREFEARIAVTRAGLAALAAHRRDGSFPAEFALPTDPYTGQPLLYEVREDGTARIEAARPLRDGEDPRDVEIAWELVPPVTR